MIEIIKATFEFIIMVGLFIITFILVDYLEYLSM